MADEPENHTLHLLREMREEQNRKLDGIQSQLTNVLGHVEDLRHRVDGNTLILNMLAGVLSDHETRLDRLEGKEPA